MWCMLQVHLHPQKLSVQFDSALPALPRGTADEHAFNRINKLAI